MSRLKEITLLTKCRIMKNKRNFGALRSEWWEWGSGKLGREGFKKFIENM